MSHDFIMHLLYPYFSGFAKTSQLLPLFIWIGKNIGARKTLQLGKYRVACSGGYGRLCYCQYFNLRINASLIVIDEIS